LKDLEFRDRISHLKTKQCTHEHSATISYLNRPTTVIPKVGRFSPPVGGWQPAWHQLAASRPRGQCVCLCWCGGIDGCCCCCLAAHTAPAQSQARQQPTQPVSHAALSAAQSSTRAPHAARSCRSAPPPVLSEATVSFHRIGSSSLLEPC
jgi:hypothetical protein